MQPDILHILMTVKPARLAKRHKRIVHIYYGAGFVAAPINLRKTMQT